MPVLTGEQIPKYKLAVLRSGLKLECLGMRRRGESCYSIVKKEFGFKGSKREVLCQLEEKLNGTRT